MASVMDRRLTAVPDVLLPEPLVSSFSLVTAAMDLAAEVAERTAVKPNDYFPELPSSEQRAHAETQPGERENAMTTRQGHG